VADTQITTYQDTVSRDQDKSFREVAKFVRDHSALFQNAGKWLDQHYGDAAYTKAETERLTERCRASWAAIKRTEKDHRKRKVTRLRHWHVKNVRLESERPILPLRRFFAAMLPFVKDRSPRPLATEMIEAAYRVLLLTCVLGDPMKDETSRGLTEFACVPWRREQAYSEEDFEAREYWLSFVLGEPSLFRKWMEIAGIALDMAEAAGGQGKNIWENIDPEGWSDARTLAEKTGLPYDRLRKRLDRWRARHADGWRSAAATNKVNEPLILYRFRDVRPVCEELRSDTMR